MLRNILFVERILKRLSEVQLQLCDSILLRRMERIVIEASHFDVEVHALLLFASYKHSFLTLISQISMFTVAWVA